MSESHPRPRTQWSVVELLLIAAAFLLLYLPLGSIDYDANGVIEAQNLETGARLSPNHILYSVLGRGLHATAQAFGYQGKAIHVLQLLDGFCGAIAVVLACMAFVKLGVSRRAALAAAALWGTSFIFWYFSTDVNYVMLAAVFTAAALWCSASLMAARSASRAVWLGVLVSLATLTFQMMVFLLPVLLWPLRKYAREAARCILTVALLLGGSYLVVGASQGHTNPVDLLHWVGGYAGGQLPEWGRFEVGRIEVAASAGIRSFQWDAVEKLKDLGRHPTRIYAWRLASGAICFGVLAFVTLLLSIQQLLDGNKKFFWMIAAYLLFWPFIVWFSPEEAYWFIIPNLFLCGAAAFVWSPWLNRPAGLAFVFGGVAVMATATFISWVWTKHIDAGVVGRKVECLAQMLEPNDTVIATDWTFPARLEYFRGVHSIQVIDLATSMRNREKLFDYLSSEIQKTRERHGRVFIVDPASYTPQHLTWLREQTEFTPADFDRFQGRVRFQCEDAKLREVTSFN